MTAYTISWDEAAVGDFTSLQKDVRERIIKKVGSIAGNPFHFAARLTGYPFFRIRVGDYRVVLDVRPQEKKIIVILVGHRSEVYTALGRRTN